MATYVLKKPVADVTDADIMGAVQARCRTLKNEFVRGVTSLFRQKHKMDLSIPDCDARVFRYYEDFNGIMEDNGLQGLIGADNTTDAGFKNRMKTRCRLLDYAAKGDSKAAKPDRKPQKTSHAGASTKAESSAAQPSASAREPRASRPPPQEGCLVCKGAHWLKDFPTATDVQKETARARYQAEKEQRTQAFRSKAAHTGTTRNIVRINGLLEVPYIADTGADQNVVSSAMMDSLHAVQPDLRTNSLSSPINVTLADGRPELCGMEVVLEIVTIAGHVSLRSIPCLILEGDGDEFLLGKDALKRLGIDVDQALAQLADSILLVDEDDEFLVGDELPNLKSTPIITLDRLLERAVANGLPQEHVIAVRELLELFPDIWRAVVGAGRAASVAPLRVTLRVDAKPYRSPPRKYAPLQAEFIREYVKSLVADGLVEKSNAARWACTVVPVRKPGSRDNICLTIDYRLVNRQTIPIAGVMPSAAVVMEVLLGQKVFARFDLTQGFWQLPLHPDSQELFSFVTPDGVYTPKQVPQGVMDSALHFQDQMQPLLAPLIPHSALVWVDDVILFAPTIDELLEVLKKFFTIVAEANLVLNMEKRSLFELEILWRGRLFSADGVQHDPTRVDALSTLLLPVTAADLQRFIFATNWLHDSLPDYTGVIAALHDKLEAEKKRIGQRNSNALQVAITWTQEECSCYKRVLSLVKGSALMVHPDPDAELCVFTDASRFGFSIVVTQVVTWQQDVPVEKQNRIVTAYNDLEYLLLRPRGFRLFCDHGNLIYIFVPRDELKKHKILPRHSRPLDVNEPDCKLIFSGEDGGHRGQEAMPFALKDRFFIVKLEDKIAQFIRQCLLCKHFKGPRLIPQPYGDSAYLLVVKDGISRYCDLFPCVTPTANVAAEVLMMWHARFGTPKTLMSDQGSYFRNEMINHLAARLKIEPKFSSVYLPWLNGTIERLNRDVLQVLRALLLEYALDSHEWPYLLPAIQANLNHTPVRSLAGHSPVEVFTGLPASSALDVVVALATEAADERVIELGDMDGHLERLRTSLQEMHREVVDSKEKKRLVDMQDYKGALVNFEVGDFVLWSHIDQRLPNHKVLGQWVGPFKVIEALSHSFKIEHLVTGRVDDPGRWELLVSWLGLQTIENSWEPLSTLLQDVPVKVREYVNASGSDELCAQID
ncbi:Hypothetical protein PHPALM_3984 [Phytophthora palmivora]|uniref:Reverse transcriptase n=1 Tax=Phytophthora palmivora TaxID=4796 RepID=A0A2P4YL22_9STRA|nr:Hypothetical protein PHPALM_3984 [Phytophthora palmivora]